MLSLFKDFYLFTKIDIWAVTKTNNPEEISIIFVLLICKRSQILLFGFSLHAPFVFTFFIFMVVRLQTFFFVDVRKFHQTRVYFNSRGPCGPKHIDFVHAASSQIDLLTFYFIQGRTWKPHPSFFSFFFNGMSMYSNVRPEPDVILLAGI